MRLTKAEKAALKRATREQEIYAKSAEELTAAEWKWLRDVMEKIHQDPRGRKRGGKRGEQYDDWMHKIARARVKGQKPPRLRVLAGIARSAKELPGQYKEQMDALRDRFKKAKKQRQIPAPPMR